MRARALRGILPAVLLLGGVLPAAGKPETISGEVIDSACYIKMGSQGPDHAKCAEDCAKAGIPLALLTDDGKVVWLASGKDMEGVNALLLPWVAKRVTLEGEWAERGGARLFSVTRVKGSSGG